MCDITYYMLVKNENGCSYNTSVLQSSWCNELSVRKETCSPEKSIRSANRYSLHRLLLLQHRFIFTYQ